MNYTQATSIINLRGKFMPNWCENELIIKTNDNHDEDLDEIIEKYCSIRNDNEQCIDFEKISPIPKMKEEDWYNWNCNNWGTKWNAQGWAFENEGLQLFFSFGTAWSPPIPVIQQLSATFPHCRMILKYCEPGMCFAGKTIFRAGKILEEVNTEDIKHPIFKHFGHTFEEED